MRKLRLLTLISYKFLPANLGGHLAHVYFHNAISEYLESIVISKTTNEPVLEKRDIKFELIPIFTSQISTYLPFSNWQKISALVKKKDADTIMCSHPYLGPTAWLVAKICGIPLISYSHNIESERFKSMKKPWWLLMYYFERWVLRKSRLTFFVTQEDRLWAIANYGLDDKACMVSPFGIDLEAPPIKNIEARHKLLESGLISKENSILYFVGAYNYQPNDTAVSDIIHEIYPRLEARGISYKILIVGKGLNQKLRKEIDGTSGKVIYLGFVEDISDVLDAADIMLNPMTLGGGIKTKAIEALGHDIKVVSTSDGAKGLDPDVCLGMLYISPDNDWDSFTDNIVKAIKVNSHIGSEFYEAYSWKGVTLKAAKAIESLISK